MAVNPTLDQRAAGGVAKALANEFGLNATALNQYNATAGVWGQIYTAARASGSAISQYYATGGALGNLLALGTGTSGATG